MKTITEDCGIPDYVKKRAEEATNKMIDSLNKRFEEEFIIRQKQINKKLAKQELDNSRKIKNAMYKLVQTTVKFMRWIYNHKSKKERQKHLKKMNEMMKEFIG